MSKTTATNSPDLAQQPDPKVDPTDAAELQRLKARTAELEKLRDQQNEAVEAERAKTAEGETKLAALRDESSEQVERLRKERDEARRAAEQRAEPRSVFSQAATPDYGLATAVTTSPAFEDLPPNHPLKGGVVGPAVSEQSSQTVEPAIVKAPGSPIANR